jgi:hypothetical protein
MSNPITPWGTEMTLAEKMELIEDSFREFAIGWNNSGCFYHFQYGPSGCGNMMEGFGKKFNAHDAETFEEAIDQFIAHTKIPFPLVRS